MFDHCGFNSKLNISISMLQSGYDGRSVLLTAGRRIRTLHTRILMPRDYGEVVDWKNFMPHYFSQKRTMQESMHAKARQVKCATCLRMHQKNGGGVGLGAGSGEILGHRGATLMPCWATWNSIKDGSSGSGVLLKTGRRIRSLCVSG